ncbi:hypothetical protein [Thiobacillus sp. 63-78]|uniref:hypothetical protein n=1 Tax=Thiobacillus sp. 63-78 TaxID=1895859 RepID=UPI001AC31F3E|nr:hypothetical protein [Thiobacillus sp. 63-78]MBN8762422.1 hypothetical protein [Thiobacillus sp.]
MSHSPLGENAALVFERAPWRSTVTSSFMAVPVASLGAILIGSGLFTSSERSRETDYQKSAGERFERFHLDILSRGLADRGR